MKSSSDKSNGMSSTPKGLEESLRNLSRTRMRRESEEAGLKELKEWQVEKAVDFWMGHMRGEAAGENLGFLTRLLVQVNLPHDEPEKGLEIWTRKNGEAYLQIQPGFTIDPKTGEAHKLGYPFGVIPRLLLIFLVSEALRTKSRVIFVGKSLSEFVEKIGLKATGGKKGDITRLKDQLYRLLKAKIEYGANRKEGNIRMEFGGGAGIASKWMLLWDWKGHEGEMQLFESQVELDADFFAEIMRHPIPLDLRVVSVIRQSPLALDLYTWLTYRVNSLQKPFKLSWGLLAEQIGSNYGRLTDFQRKASKALKEIQRVWPVEVEIVHGGVLLKPSKPSVPQIPKPTK